MGDRRPNASDAWTLDEWRTYRAVQAAAVERFGDPWAERCGRPLVALADRAIARLEAEMLVS